MKNLLSVEEIAKHGKEDDCWIVVDGEVYDITQFAPEHPGGPGIIYKYAGRDASIPYNEIHAPSIIKSGLPTNAHKGRLDTSTTTEEWLKPLPSETPKAKDTAPTSKPPLDSIINLHDFEIAARNSASAKTWAFYSSAANDLITKDLNASIYPRILFRPRTLRRVRNIDTSINLFGHKMSFPLFISPAAMARLIHPDGELAIARACSSHSLIQSISNNASYSATEIVSQPEVKDHPFIFQLYVDRRREKTAGLLKRLGQHKNIIAIQVTIDAATAGKREADERVKADESIVNPMQKNRPVNDKKGGGYGRLMAGYLDSNLCWDDLKWIREQLNMWQRDVKLLVKGVMTAEDAKLAQEAGLDGIVLSNHGGRNLDTSPPAVLVLLEIHKRFPELIREYHPSSPGVKAGLNKPFSIMIDGGIRRGTDVLKCVCLGAVAVGVGRPALFATGYGQEGVEHMIDILKDEFEVAMKNNGLTSIDEAGPEYVNTGDIDWLVPSTRTHPYAVSWSGITNRQSRL